MKNQPVSGPSPSSRDVGWGTRDSTPVGAVAHRKDCGCNDSCGCDACSPGPAESYEQAAPVRCTRTLTCDGCKWRYGTKRYNEVMASATAHLPCAHCDENYSQWAEEPGPLLTALCEVFDRLGGPASARPDKCYVCSATEHLQSCTHCESMICAQHARDGLCTLCYTARSNMAREQERRARHDEEMVRACELAEKAAATAAYDAGVTAAILTIEQRAQTAPGLAGDVLRAMASELRAKLIAAVMP